MRRATTAPKADMTESEGAVLRHHAQGAGLRSLPRPCAGTASQAPRSSLAFLPRLSSRVSAGEAQAPGMKSRRNEPLTLNTFLMMQPGDLGL